MKAADAEGESFDILGAGIGRVGRADRSGRLADHTSGHGAVLQTNPRSGRTRAFFGYFAARLSDHSRGEQETEQALQFAPRDKVVLRCAVVTYEMPGRRERALQIAATAMPDLLRELDRHPDLADFRLDPRFEELKVNSRVFAGMTSRSPHLKQMITSTTSLSRSKRNACPGSNTRRFDGSVSRFDPCTLLAGDISGRSRLRSCCSPHGTAGGVVVARTAIRDACVQAGNQRCRPYRLAGEETFVDGC